MINDIFAALCVGVSTSIIWWGLDCASGLTEARAHGEYITVATAAASGAVLMAGWREIRREWRRAA